jgi:hypothetical protein
VARKLEGLPLLTAALEAAEISWSKVEILVRRATPQNEAELLAEAKSMTVRALRDAHADGREKDEDEERFMTLSLSLAKEDRVLLEGTRMLLTELEDGARGDLWVEALLAEGQTSLVSCVPPGSEIVPDDIVAAQESGAAELERMATRRREAERRAEGRIAREIPHEERDASDVEELSDDPIRLDRQLRSDAAELAARDQWMGLLGAKVLALGGWRALGYASERQYCRERLGISRASFRKKIALANGTARFALLEQALLNGTIGVEAALLARPFGRAGSTRSGGRTSGSACIGAIGTAAGIRSAALGTRLVTTSNTAVTRAGTRCPIQLPRATSVTFAASTRVASRSAATRRTRCGSSGDGRSSSPTIA